MDSKISLQMSACFIFVDGVALLRSSMIYKLLLARLGFGFCPFHGEAWASKISRLSTGPYISITTFHDLLLVNIIMAFWTGLLTLSARTSFSSSSRGIFFLNDLLGIIDLVRRLLILHWPKSVERLFKVWGASWSHLLVFELPFFELHYKELKERISVICLAGKSVNCFHVRNT